MIMMPYKLETRAWCKFSYSLL